MRLPSWVSYIPKKWHVPPKAMYTIFAIEVAVSVPALALYGIAKPDTYRTRLWQEGYNQGWNSDPKEVLYAYANSRPIPDPLPWSQFTTSFSVVLAILTLFIQLLKGIMFICGVLYPLLALIVHAALTACWAIAVHAQAGPDTSGENPNTGPPWYITKSCGPPVSAGNQGYCKQAKGAFAMGVLLAVISFIYFLLSLYSLLHPFLSPSARRKLKLSSDEEDSPVSSPHNNNDDRNSSYPWEMQMHQVPATPGTTGGLKSPATPRTMAFNTLSGDRKGKGKGKSNKKGKEPLAEQTTPRLGNGELPLRHHIAMGDETYQPKGARFA